MLLVDGYNLLFQLRPELAGRGPTDADRDELVRLVARTGQSAVVYFDPGPGYAGPRFVRHVGAVKVVHLDRGEADGAILEELRATEDRKKFHVVTSDGAVRREAEALGFRVTASKDFLAAVDRTSPGDAEPRGKTEGTSEGEADYWLREMGGDTP